MTFGERATRAESAVTMLLFDAIDYAGLFPPAALDMPGAVSEYASYLTSGDRWALGRFVVPASRLEELVTCAVDLAPASVAPDGSARPWRLSVVFGADALGEMGRVNEFHRTHGDDNGMWSARVEAVEARAQSPAEVQAIAAIVPSTIDRFVEIPISGDVRSLVQAIGAAGAFAKVRTGGTTAEAFPSSADVARFLSACVSEGVPFKATAGLHHPVRGEYPLTYAPDSARGTMFGFLNVFLAAALLQSGENEEVAREALDERNAGAIRFDTRELRWNGRALSMDQLAASRNGAIRSFGSCSFREPIDELESLGVL